MVIHSFVHILKSSFFPGVHLKDLIAVDNALPDYMTEKKLINFQKMVKFYSVIATLMNFKNMQPPAPSKFELINMLRVSMQSVILCCYINTSYVVYMISNDFV